jgi:hypothetical protein
MKTPPAFTERKGILSSRGNVEDAAVAARLIPDGAAAAAEASALLPDKSADEARARRAEGDILRRASLAGTVSREEGATLGRLDAGTPL